jgi:hypothetical protein
MKNYSAKYEFWLAQLCETERQYEKNPTKENYDKMNEVANIRISNDEKYEN